MKELLLKLAQLALIAAAIFLASFVCTYIDAKKKEIASRITNRNVSRALSQALDAVKKAVSCTNQTYVDELKKSDSFDSENQRIAFSMACETAKRLMTEETHIYLNSAYDNFSEWLTAQVEAEVREQKEAHLPEIAEGMAYEAEILCGDEEISGSALE